MVRPAMSSESYDIQSIKLDMVIVIYKNCILKVVRVADNRNIDKGSKH